MNIQQTQCMINLEGRNLFFSSFWNGSGFGVPEPFTFYAQKYTPPPTDRHLHPAQPTTHNC